MVLTPRRRRIRWLYYSNNGTQTQNLQLILSVTQVDDAYLVTGNIKHFPLSPFVVTPREMLTILEQLRQTAGMENR